MEIFSNWIFWVCLAAIVFILALIGYLTESMKEHKTDVKKNENTNDNNKDVKPENLNNIDTEPQINEVQGDDWTTMPDVQKPIDEPNDSAKTEDLFSAPVSSNEVLTNNAESEVTSTNEQLSTSNEEKPVTGEPESLNVSENDDKTSDIWS